MMNKHNPELGSKVQNTKGFLAGVLIGGLAGAGAMLLLAPNSGKQTRAKIQQKSIELRDQATDAMDDAVAQVRVKTRQLTTDIGDKAEKIQHRSQTMINEQKERFANLVEGGKKAIQGSSAETL